MAKKHLPRCFGDILQAVYIGELTASPESRGDGSVVDYTLNFGQELSALR